MIDITEQKKLQQHLKRAHEMEAITTLAGGIAHDFNNALVGIVGNVELMKMDLAELEKVSRYLEAMLESARRMAHRTNQLLAYARGGRYQPKALSLSHFVSDTLPLVMHEIDRKIRVETRLESEPRLVEVDSAQMQMALAAIVVNAAEAIAGEGCIRIKTKNEDIDEERSEDMLGSKPGTYVSLSVEDDGIGMDEKIMSRIFEPFFTTKFQGRGLGLAAVYGIVSHHGGWISVDSASGRGTKVTVFLPACVSSAECTQKAVTESFAAKKTILVIEDEELVMNVTTACLEKLGYTVLSADSGAAATALVEGYKGEIDLVLLDIGLPDMDAETLFSRMRAARRNLRVLVCSGFSIDGPAREIIEAGALGFIQKPYALEELSSKLVEALKN